MTASAPAIVQAPALITIVFGFTWWSGGVLGLDDKLRALLSSAVHRRRQRPADLVPGLLSIGLEFSLRRLREARWRPNVAFGSVVVVNLAVGLGISVLLFRDFAV